MVFVLEIVKYVVDIIVELIVWIELSGGLFVLDSLMFFFFVIIGFIIVLEGYILMSVYGLRYNLDLILVCFVSGICVVVLWVVMDYVRYFVLLKIEIDEEFFVLDFVLWDELWVG